MSSLVSAQSGPAAIGNVLAGELPRQPGVIEQLLTQWENIPDITVDLRGDGKTGWDVWLAYKNVRPEGTLRWDGHQQRGTGLKLHNSLGMAHSEETILMGMSSNIFIVQGLSLRLGFDVSMAEFRGLATVPPTGFYVTDRLLSPGSQMTSALDFFWYRPSIGYTIYPDKKWGFGFDFCGEYVRLDYRLQGQTATESVRKRGELEIFLPLTGLHLDFCPDDRWFIGVAANRCVLSLLEREVWVVNVTSTVRYYPTPYFYVLVRAEWQFADHKVVAEEPMDIDIDIETWSVGGGVGVRF